MSNVEQGMSRFEVLFACVFRRARYERLFPVRLGCLQALNEGSDQLVTFVGDFTHSCRIAHLLPLDDLQPNLRFT